jgi:hypothetical protein
MPVFCDSDATSKPIAQDSNQGRYHWNGGLSTTGDPYAPKSIQVVAFISDNQDVTLAG